MSEPFTSSATRFGEGKSKSVAVEIIPHEKVGEGAYGIVSRVTTLIKRVIRGKERQRELPLIYKGYSYLEPWRAERMLDLHAYLNDPNFPMLKVVPILRATEKGLLMTDLSEGGKNLVLSKNEIDYARQGYILRLVYEQPEFALQLLTIDLQKLHNTMMEIGSALSAKKILSPIWDLFFLVYKPTGEFEIYEVDLDVARRCDPREKCDTRTTIQNCETFFTAFKVFLADLRKELQRAGYTNI